MGDESEALQDWSYDSMAADFIRDQSEKAYFKDLNDMQNRYIDNKRSEIGTTIRCACCSKRIIKRSYQSQFCSNKGPGNCKDTYWNNVDDKRRDRAKYFA